MRWKILLVLCSATLLLAACGGGNGASPTPTPAPSGTQPTGSTPAPTLGPVLDGSLFPILSHTSFRTAHGLFFVGEVQNNSGADAYDVIVKLNLTDDAGKDVGSGHDGLQAKPYLPAGESMAFKMSVSGGAQSWNKENFSVEAHQATPNDIAQAYMDFRIDGGVAVKAQVGLTVQGLLTNTGTKAANPIKLMFVARDASGTVIGAWGANPAQGLNPGQETTFGFPVLDVADVPPSYEITAYALVQ